MSSSSVQRQAAIIWAANGLIQRWEDFLQYISADRRSPCGLWIVHVAIMQMRREEWDQRWTAEKGWMVMDCLMWDDGGLGRVRWKWQEISLKPSRVGPKENWVVIIMRNATCTADAVIDLTNWTYRNDIIQIYGRKGTEMMGPSTLFINWWVSISILHFHLLVHFSPFVSSG